MKSYPQILTIEAGGTELHYGLYRELHFFMGCRDLLVRYKQTPIGFVWGMLSAYLTMLVSRRVESNECNKSTFFYQS